MGWQEDLEKLTEDGVPIMLIKTNLDRKETSQDLSSAVLNYTTDIVGKFKVHQVLIHSSANLDDTTITVSFNSLTGANYDTAIGQADFDGTADIGLIAGDNLLGVIGESGDELTIKSSGTDAVGILYVTIIYEILT